MLERKAIQGVEVPSLGLGTYNLRGRACVNTVREAIALGYRHFDTAQMYKNEAEVGVGLKESGVDRDSVFITTKVWPSNFSRQSFIPSVQKSLRDLMLESVDLLLLHWPADNETNAVAVELLNQCFESGYAKHVGVSNFSIEQIDVARTRAPIFCNQILYHVHEHDERMRSYSEEHNLLLTAYSPLAVGRIADDAELQRMGKQHGKSGAQIALRWLIQQSRIAAIPKASSTSHLKENLDLFDFHLSDEEMAALSNRPSR